MTFPFQKSRLAILAVAVFFVLLLNLFDNPVRSFLYAATAPAQSFLWHAGKGVSDFFEGFLQGPRLRSMNAELESENLLLKSFVAELQDTKEENKQLRESLGLGLDKEFVLMRADIIHKDIAQDSLVVNVGSQDGIEAGMPLITPQKVLAGRITQVFATTARAELVSHDNSSFDVKVLDSPATGLWKGQGRNRAVLDLVPKDVLLRQGDLVVTSRLGGVFPENLLVGLVQEAMLNDAAPFQKADVEVLFKIQDAEFLFVIAQNK